MPIYRISGKSFDLLPEHGPAIYKAARAKFKEKTWGRGSSMIARDLAPDELEAFTSRVRRVKDRVSGSAREVLIRALGALAKQAVA